MQIHVNEVGYLPGERKMATADGLARFHVIDEKTGKPCEKELWVADAGVDPNAGEQTYLIDFSEIREAGRYHLEAEDGSRSVSFEIKAHVYKDMKNAMLKALYYQRCGMELEEQYAGVYTHPKCHMGLSHLYEDPSVKMEVLGGWHDAGDFGRYVSPAGVSVGHLLYAYELFPECFTETVNIPESGNGMPDILNECYYELDWMMQMQHEDGGVYHKQTTAMHADFIMPEDDHGEMIIYPVSSMATADFAAAMCIASRVYEPFDPEFARNCMHAAMEAGQWLLKNPEFLDFHNPADCGTGEYGDEDPDDTDERLWAFAELLRTDVEIRNDYDHSMMAGMPQKSSRQKDYLKQVQELAKKYFEADDKAFEAGDCKAGFGWANVSTLALTAILFDPEMHADADTLDLCEEKLLRKAEALKDMQKELGYPVSMTPKSFSWGSNMVVCNRGDLLILAALYLKKCLTLDAEGKSGRPEKTELIKVVEYTIKQEDDGFRLTPEARKEMEAKIAAYEAAALENLHYLCGRNPNEVSYVTGFGEHAFLHPHNRVCACDGIDAPIPGEVSGGPYFFPVDPDALAVVPKDAAPAKCYADVTGSYSTNEIAIYWNTSALFLTAYADRS